MLDLKVGKVYVLSLTPNRKFKENVELVKIKSIKEGIVSYDIINCIHSSLIGNNYKITEDLFKGRIIKVPK